MSAALDRLNARGGPDAAEELRRFCGSREWARRMAEERPFRDLAHLLEAADRIWEGCGREDRLEAFAAHPRIGDPRAAGREAEEQSGARAESAETLARLAEGNRRYEQRFGHVFLICASGRSGPEMLAALGRRLGNDAEEELGIAALEQRKITRLRLEKAFGE